MGAAPEARQTILVNDYQASPFSHLLPAFSMGHDSEAPGGGLRIDSGRRPPSGVTLDRTGNRKSLPVRYAAHLRTFFVEKTCVRGQREILTLYGFGKRFRPQPDRTRLRRVPKRQALSGARRWEKRQNGRESYMPQRRPKLLSSNVNIPVCWQSRQKMTWTGFRVFAVSPGVRHGKTVRDANVTHWCCSGLSEWCDSRRIPLWADDWG